MFLISLKSTLMKMHRRYFGVAKEIASLQTRTFKEYSLDTFSQAIYYMESTRLNTVLTKKNHNKDKVFQLVCLFTISLYLIMLDKC